MQSFHDLKLARLEVRVLPLTGFNYVGCYMPFDEGALLILLLCCVVLIERYFVAGQHFHQMS